MQTSARPPVLLEYTSTLIHAAEARTRVLDGHDHSVPVVCLDIELDSALRNRMHVEMPYPADQHAQATAEAKRLKKGMHVTVQAPPMDLQLVARNVSHIAVIPEPATDLF